MTSQNSTTSHSIKILLHRVESLFLGVIAIFTIIAMCQEIFSIMHDLSVELEDLLLMFIYVEVLAMVGIYYDSKKIPIILPLYIAITALARLVILQGKDQSALNYLIETSSILLLTISCFVFTYKFNQNNNSKD
ncbi:MAG: phosphate-starvation-inducible protein PsiE [Hyphomicrobium sp.]